MKKKILLKIKKWILTIRKTYRSQKEIITDFLKSDLSDFLKNDNYQEEMIKLNVQDETELKLKALNIYGHYFTVEEHQQWYDYIIKTSKKAKSKKLIQEKFPY